MFDYSKLSNTVGSLSGFGRRCILGIDLVGSLVQGLGFPFLLFREISFFLVWSCVL